MAPMKIAFLMVGALYAVYGMFRFPPWRFHSPRLVTRPTRLFWTLGRLLDDREWTEEGRQFQRAFLRWLAGLVVVMVMLAVVLALL